VAGCCPNAADPTVTNANVVNNLRMVLNITALLSRRREPVVLLVTLAVSSHFDQGTEQIVLNWDN
jgi:hypothetical protein